MSDEDVEALREQVKALQAKLDEGAGDARRRRRVAMLLLVGGAAAGLSGVLGHSIFMIVSGIGWIFGGAAVASTVPGPKQP